MKTVVKTKICGKNQGRPKRESKLFGLKAGTKLALSVSKNWDIIISFDVYNLFCPCFDGLLVITCQQPSFQGGKGNCVLRNDYELNTAIISSPIHNVNSLINI